MLYPAYPQPNIDNVKAEGYTHKYETEALIRYALQLQGMGFYPVPKRTGAKIAHWKFWMKKNGHVPLDVTEETLREWLPRRDVDGLILAVGKSMNGRLVVLDIDPAGDHVTGEATYHAIQELSPTGYVIVTPSNGLHLYYLLPDGVEPLKPTSKVVWDNLDIRGKNSLIGLPGSYQQYTDTASRKGVAYGHVGSYHTVRDLVGSNYDVVPTMSMELYQKLLDAQTIKKATTPVATGATNYAQTEEGIRRLEEHARRPLQEREKLTVECLSYVLAGWRDKTYDQWLQVWMAAHHGSGGSPLVREFIATHSDVWTGRSETEVDQFRETWDAHTPVEGGYTVASLMYLARNAGWLQSTGLEIPDKVVEKIAVRYIQQWTETLDEIPTRLLLQSQTGSGKTYNLAYLYNRLGRPKTVVFVPTTKLAIELANTLKNDFKLPVTLYINEATGRTKPADELVNAKLLVTTLQTFGTKVHPRSSLKNYGLVYIEESDQLLQQFGRGGGGPYSSHVGEEEARNGFATIRDAFQNAGVVWCVDATMTQVTYYIAEQMREDHPLRVVRNMQIEPKAPVTLLAEKGEAYQTILSGLLEGKKVVVACDTAQSAKEVVDTMERVRALEGKKAILITAHTERDPDVQAFMKDVNKQAQQYDLVCYNSVMGSGVSITSVVPDLVVQIANYLTPRSNLQLLNRYRHQKVVYCHYQSTDNLYNETDVEVLTEAYRRAGLEAAAINLPLAERVPDAVIRARVAAMSRGDEALQRRSATAFYYGLLQRDGREVREIEPVTVSAYLRAGVKAVREAHKAHREELKGTWPDVRPIDRDDPADADMTELEIAQGETHAWIQRSLAGHIPTDVDPVLVYEVVHSFRSTAVPLTAFVRQQETLKQAEQYLADDGRAITTLSNHITLTQVLSNLAMMYRSLDEVVPRDVMEVRAGEFLRLMHQNREAYDAIINSPRQKFAEVLARSDDPLDQALDFSKILLARIGLRQRSTRAGRKGKGGAEGATYTYTIENAEQARLYLQWRYPNEQIELKFGDTDIRGEIQKRSSHLKMFQAMTAKQQAEVMHMLNVEKSTTFEIAVESVMMGTGF
jgi:Bifunctional DNA primase/polymerase, N-terminal/DEAD/DEAH box helicase/Primase C terminal 2 (PriCT-2)